MGLDIYLYRYDDFGRVNALEDEAEAHANEAWQKAGGWDALTDAERDEVSAANKAWNAERGLGEWGEVLPPAKIKVELPSARWPDHLFKVGYFRSSYNDGGFNRVAFNLVGKDLAWIFDVGGDDYHVRPDWKAALARASQVSDELEKEPQIGAFNVSPINLFEGTPEPVDTARAIEIYKEQASRATGPFGDGWSNKAGEFFPHNPLKVLALVNGIDVFKRPAIIVVHEKDLSSYVQSARIVAETCQYVLDTGEPEKHVLHWSG